MPWPEVPVLINTNYAMKTFAQLSKGLLGKSKER